MGGARLHVEAALAHEMARGVSVAQDRALLEKWGLQPGSLGPKQCARLDIKERQSRRWVSVKGSAHCVADFP